MIWQLLDIIYLFDFVTRFIISVRFSEPLLIIVIIVTKQGIIVSTGTETSAKGPNYFGS